MNRISTFLMLSFIFANAVFSQLSFKNGSFEDPDNGIKYSANGSGGWYPQVMGNNLPGWWADSDATDSGREHVFELGQVPDGKYCGYAHDKDGTIWNLTGIVEDNMLDLGLTFYVSYNWAQDITDNFFVIIKLATFEGTDTSGFEVISTLEQPFEGTIDPPDWTLHTFEETLPESAVGKNLMIGFDMDSEGDNYAFLSFDQFELTVTGTAGISDRSKTSLNIYPNPSTGIFSLEGLQDETSFQIFDLTGKQLSAGILGIHDNTINLSDLPNSIYILRTGSGGVYQYNKLIVK
jgi:hypothetical protein